MKRQVILWVFAVHGLILAMLGVDHWMRKRDWIPKKMVVRTQTLILPAPFIPSAPAGQTPVAKREGKKPKPTPAKQKATVKKVDDSALQEIEESFRRIAQPVSSSKKTELSVPALNLPTPTAQEFSSMELFVAFLQDALVLPEYGEVKVKLSFHRNGKLDQIEILSSQSEKNASFLKNRLPELQFPCLNEDTSLTIVFSNAL